MIVNTEKDGMFQSNIEGIESYSVAANAKMFSILSTQIYKNPVRAVIRELCCNAVDAHRQIGQTQKFQLSLPTAFDNEFSVTDFGVGMSLLTMIGTQATRRYFGNGAITEEGDAKYVAEFGPIPTKPEDFIPGVYTTYGESTKDMSEDLTGGFGIGSKTPFAYTSMFTVLSIKDGMKTIILNFLDGNRLPKYKVIMHEPTDESSGTRVSFQVLEGDEDRFATEAIPATLFLMSFPEITRGIDLMEENMPWVNGKGGKATIEDLQEYNQQILNKEVTPELQHFCRRISVSTPMVVMGGVSYLIDVDEAYRGIKAYDNNWGTKNAIGRFFNNQMIFYSDLGTLTMQPSREALAYDPRTMEQIRKVFSDTFINFFEKLNEVETPSDAVKILLKNEAMVDTMSNLHFEFTSDKNDDMDNDDDFIALFGQDIADKHLPAVRKVQNIMIDINKKFNSTTASFTEVSLRRNIKYSNPQVSSIQYQWQRSTSALLAMKRMTGEHSYVLKSDNFMEWFTPTGAARDRSRFINMKRDVVSRLNPYYKDNSLDRSDDVFIYSPQLVALLEDLGLDVSEIANFDTLRKVTYTNSVPRAGGKGGAASVDMDVEIEYSPEDFESDDWDEVVEFCRENNYRLLWIVKEYGDFLYMGSDKKAFTKDRKSESHLPTNFAPTLAAILKKFGMTQMSNTVVVSISYMAAKSLKLYKSYGTSVQKFIEDVVPLMKEPYVKLASVMNEYNKCQHMITIAKIYEKNFNSTGDIQNIIFPIVGITDKDQDNWNDENRLCTRLLNTTNAIHAYHLNIHKKLVERYPLIQYALDNYHLDNVQYHNFAEYCALKDGATAK